MWNLKITSQANLKFLLIQSTPVLFAILDTLSKAPQLALKKCQIFSISSFHQPNSFRAGVVGRCSREVRSNDSPKCIARRTELQNWELIMINDALNLNWAIGADAAIAPATMCGNLVLEQSNVGTGKKVPWDRDTVSHCMKSNPVFLQADEEGAPEPGCQHSSITATKHDHWRSFCTRNSCLEHLQL